MRKNSSMIKSWVVTILSPSAGGLATSAFRDEIVTFSTSTKGYYALSEYQKALAYYLLALPLQRAMGDRRGEASTLSNIGIVHYYLGEYQQALDYYLQALPLRRAVGDGPGAASTLGNIGALYNERGE